MSVVAELEFQIVRLADAVGLLRPSSAHTRALGRIAAQPLEFAFGGATMDDLAALARPDHPLMRCVETTCSQGCGATWKHEASWEYFSSVTACDACRAKWEEKEANDLKKKKWEALCPSSFLDTDTKHAGFPRRQYAQLKDWVGERSLFFHGPSGQGKSRLAVLLMKRALHLGKTVGILWPWDIKTLAQNYDSTFDSYSKVPVLLVDDPFLKVCRESKLVDVLKDLIDRRMLNEKVTIFTSQIATSSDMTGAKEYGEASNADIERIDAILRRLKESCEILQFLPDQPKVEIQEEAPF
ncbi:MAG: ATP-binding protein [Proteobacteria bacterium]|nr:ATP-binding protein [Pseudomonadota bacterium]